MMRSGDEATASNATPEISPQGTIEATAETDLLQAGKYSDVKENLRSLAQIS